MPNMACWKIHHLYFFYSFVFFPAINLHFRKISRLARSDDSLMITLITSLYCWLYPPDIPRKFPCVTGWSMASGAKMHWDHIHHGDGRMVRMGSGISRCSWRFNLAHLSRWFTYERMVMFHSYAKKYRRVVADYSKTITYKSADTASQEMRTNQGLHVVKVLQHSGRRVPEVISDPQVK